MPPLLAVTGRCWNAPSRPTFTRHRASLQRPAGACCCPLYEVKQRNYSQMLQDAAGLSPTYIEAQLLAWGQSRAGLFASPAHTVPCRAPNLQSVPKANRTAIRQAPVSDTGERGAALPQQPSPTASSFSYFTATTNCKLCLPP